MNFSQNRLIFLVVKISTKILRNFGLLLLDGFFPLKKYFSDKASEFLQEAITMIDMYDITIVGAGVAGRH